MSAQANPVNSVRIPAGPDALPGDICIPPGASAIVVFAHGSGSSRFSPRNRFVAQQLQQDGLATLLFDLLTAEEDRIDRVTREFRFNVEMLALRLVAATDWLLRQQETGALRMGYFGASTGSAAALIAAAQRADTIKAIVSRGGRPDLAQAWLGQVRAATLLIVGGLDTAVLEPNQQAMKRLTCQTQLRIVPGATHLFEQPGKLEQVAQVAGQWFRRYLLES